MSVVPRLLCARYAYVTSVLAFTTVAGLMVLGCSPLLAQVSTGNQPASVGAPSEPPLGPPEEGALPTGAGMLSFGPWLLSPTLDLYSFYDSNIHSSPTNPLGGPGFRIHPALLADWNTGIHDTKIYGNIDSAMYPTLNYKNDTFDRQAGIVETYAPLRDLSFTAQGNYAHNTNASVLTSALPTPVTSLANPPPPGTAGIVALQQTVVNPNDTLTATASMAKQFNRAFFNMGGTILRTTFDNTPSQNYEQRSYFASGGTWLTPQLYMFSDGNDATTIPTTGPSANSYRARGGLGSAQVWLFQGTAYYGHQGTFVTGDGSAGGDIYGATLSFFPTPVWDMTVTFDHITNISNITAATNIGLGGLPLSGVGVPTNASAVVNTIAYKTDYKLTDQTSLYGVVSDTRTAYLGQSRIDNNWLASAGIRQNIRHDLSVTLDLQYTWLVSPQPQTSFTRTLVSLGAHYDF